MLTRIAHALVAGLAALSVPAVAYPIEFKSVADEITVLYDAPSRQSTKRLILTRGYPVEVIIATDGWVRVRDEGGAFAWIESARLDAKRTVMVSEELADAREAPEESAPVVFRATKGVVLDFLGVSGGWAKVRHRSGMVAFVRLGVLWGV
jgi:SH3-like domain-containing protein